MDPNTQFTEVNMRNCKSATNATFKLLVEKTIPNEIQQGNYVITATIPTVESASGVIPKPNSSEARLIHDCFRRHGHAVNEFISTRYVKFQFLYDAIKLLKPNYFMAKIDLNHAYRWRPIYSANNQATGCQWRFRGTILTVVFTTPAFRSVLKALLKSFTVQHRLFDAWWEREVL